MSTPVTIGSVERVPGIVGDVDLHGHRLVDQPRRREPLDLDPRCGGLDPLQDFA
jgi:hypothetical protein